MVRVKVKSCIKCFVSVLSVLFGFRLIFLLFLHGHRRTALDELSFSGETAVSSREYSYKLHTERYRTLPSVTVTELPHHMDTQNDDDLKARTKPLGLYQTQNDYYGKHSVAQHIRSKTLYEEGANPHDFRYIIRPKELCKNVKDLSISIIVSSHPSHLDRRNIIRSTWGNVETLEKAGISIRAVFVMGLSRNSTTNRALLKESTKFNDIVLEDFITDYKNMTYAHVAGFKWISTYCNQSKWTIKTDDDVYVDIFTAIRYPEKSKLIGDFITGAITTPHVYRNGGKWQVTKSEYLDNRYQTYPMGYGYMTTTKLVSKMYHASLSTPFYWIDDVYVGILAAKVGAVRFKTCGTRNWLGKEVKIGALANGGALFTHLEGRHVDKAPGIFKIQYQRYHQKN